MKGFWASSQASAICAGVAFFLAAILASRSTTGQSAFRASRVKRGNVARRSDTGSKVIAGSTFPVRNPWPSGLYFVMGGSDMVTPVSQARTYFEKLNAPRIQWHEFERSAHFPFYEEPERFAELMRRIKGESLPASRRAGNPGERKRFRNGILAKQGSSCEIRSQS